ncbi:hypothetical protein [Streptococcus sp. KS 6]|uniref:DUF7675 family protein n=1 Tax=Streptococcus sp. KS 6 TaxID=2598457 RepID=UPI001CE08646|nr:hypothetical protein [Streptococcus sp. KS 6]
MMDKEVEIFDKENPYWKEFLSNRKNNQNGARKGAFIMLKKEKENEIQKETCGD